jgi:hypothetical protein
VVGFTVEADNDVCYVPCRQTLTSTSWPHRRSRPLFNGREQVGGLSAPRAGLVDSGHLVDLLTCILQFDPSFFTLCKCGLKTVPNKPVQYYEKDNVFDSDARSLGR